MRDDFTHWGDSPPKVSCQCITFGRLELLEESVESFLRQDYPGEKELVILNDAPNIKIYFNHDEVVVVNCDKRFDTVGGKRHESIVLSSGRIMIPWDDDDIMLPWRISVAIEEMKNKEYFKPAHLWWWNGGLKEIQKSCAHGLAAYSKTIYSKVGGYGGIQSGQDIDFEARIRSTGLRDAREIDLEKTSYIYRWGTNDYHLSGKGFNNQEFYKELGERISKLGTIERELKPNWKQDYVAMTDAKLLDMGIEREKGER